MTGSMLKEMSIHQIQDIVSVDAYLDNITHSKSVNGPFIRGTLTSPGYIIPFTKWNTDSFDEGGYHVSGHLDVYKGKKAIIVENATPIRGEKSDFTFTRYDYTSLKAKVDEFINSFTPKQKRLYDIILKGDGVVADVSDRFMVEYAASYHHDAYKYGLLAHSYKTAMLMKYFLENDMYAWYAFDDETKDILLVSAFLHDLGKVIEYHDGEISEIGKKISHRTIMAYRLTELRESLTSVISNNNFWVMLSIFEQHHGDYEETPRTLEAVLVHLCDAMDAQMTDLTSSALDVDDTFQIRFGDMKLLVPAINI